MAATFLQSDNNRIMINENILVRYRFHFFGKIAALKNGLTVNR